MDASLLAGIGGYRVERELGAGGMGRVYLCRDDALDRLVAIKVLQPELLEQSEMRARFLREARALARVTSPHVVAVHAVGEDAVLGPFVVMEYLAGEDLHMRLQRDGKLPWREAVHACRDAVQGLRAAFAAGIVHRDIKPANLFIVGGKAKLTDFGLAREIQGAAGVTAIGIVVGTPAYLAPEVIKGSAANHQSDLYSLGATLFHLVAGRPPFTAEAPLEVVAQAVREEPPRLASLAHDIPPALDDLVFRMLKKDPGARPQGFDALDSELASVVDEKLTAPPAAQRTMAFGSSGVTAPAEPSASSLRTADIPMQPATAAPLSASVAPALTSSPTVTVSPPLTVPPSEVSSPGAVRIKTATLTVMLTDIVGYTERTSRVSREESARWLALHDQLLQPVFKSFAGRIVKTLGDAFLVTFPSPTDAALCACAVQDRLWLHNQSARPEDAITVRVALSAGEVRLHKGDVFGEPVNLVARIEHLAEPGEVLLSDAVMATMNAAEVKLVSRGEHALKGIGRAVVVYAAVPDGIDGKPPFGGRALSRVRESAVTGFVANTPSARQALDLAKNLAGDKRAWVAAGAVAIVLVGLLVLALTRDDRLARIDAGGAKAVIEETEKKKDGERSGLDWAMLGHAKLALDEKERAFADFKKAVERGVHDDRIEKACLQALAKRDDDGAKDVLVAWPDKKIERDLKELLEGSDWWPRHHALAVLDARKVTTDAMAQQVALLDVTSSGCGDRRSGVQLLKKVGRGDDALDALKKLRADAFGNACLMFDLGSAESEVKKRSEK